MSTKKPQIDQTPDGYLATWDDGITASVEEIREHGGDELKAYVVIESATHGALKADPLNLLASQTKAQWVRVLQEREPEIDWHAKLDQLAKGIRDLYRAGSPAVDLAELAPSSRARWLVEPFVQASATTLLFADGGTGKSLAGMAIALSAATGFPVLGWPRADPTAVLYLDWETDQDTAAERLRAIRVGHGSPEMCQKIHYRRLYATLEASMTELRRQVTRLSIGMVVVDSLGAARGGEPESADLTIRTLNAIRALGVPALCIDHVTKQQGNDATKAFGSVFSTNLARLTWSMDKAQEESDPTVVFINRKRNDGRPLPKMAFRVRMAEDPGERIASVTYEPVSLEATELASRYLSVRDLIRAAIRTQWLSAKEISDLIGKPLDQVQSRLTNMKAKGEVSANLEHKWGITYREDN